MDRYRIQIRMDPAKIAMLDNFMEGYDGLAIVSSGKDKLGEVTVHVTPDTYDDVKAVLENLPWPVTILEEKNNR